MSMPFYAAIHYPMSAEQPESALDIVVSLISPYRARLIDMCVIQLERIDWSAVRVLEVDGNAHIQAANDEIDWNIYYVVQKVDMLQ